MERLGNLLRPQVVAAFDREFFEREGYWVWEGVLTEEARARWTASLQKLQQMNDEIVAHGLGRHRFRAAWATGCRSEQERRRNF